MLRIEGLTKTYHSKAKTTCKALDGIDLTLPDKGMVFIIGKSGSGKSTLLNVLGGLDSFDSGEVTVFGNSLSTFSVADYEAYRSDLVGFVFQDYHLIEELTVYENITLLAADGAPPSDLHATLAAVGINDLLERRPCELSGGQKQRVAIARCIVKHPKVLLCDEPTGNLDKRSSTAVMELLRRIAGERLVIVVSHNLSEAELYADRIIELADGRIVGDMKKEDGYLDRFTIRDGEALLPYRHRLSDDDVASLNAGIADRSITRVLQNSSGFREAYEPYECHAMKMEARRIQKSHIFHLFKSFLLTKKRQSISAIVIISLMFWIFAVIQSFASFDANAALSHSLTTRDPLVVVEKEFGSFPYNIYDDTSSLGKSYPMYSQTIWTPNAHGSSWDIGRFLSDDVNLSDVYIHETYGLLVCDTDYLSSRFAVDGELSLLAGSLEDSENAGILITDYFADSFIRHTAAEPPFKRLSYEDLIGVICPVGYNNAGRISGIIYTGYLEKYEALIEEYTSFDENSSDMTRKEFEEMFRADTRYIALVDDIKINLGISYTLDENYAQNVDLTELSLVKTYDLYVSVGGQETLASSLRYASTKDRSTTIAYADNEIGIPYTLYNTLFGTEYTVSDTYRCDERFGQEIVFTRYVDNNPKKGTVYSKAFTIKCITPYDPELNDTSMRLLKLADWQPSRLYFLEPQNLGDIVDYVTQNEYRVVSVEQSKLMEINKTVSLFSDLFLFIRVLLILLIAIYLISYGFKSIKANSYQIGVIKAFGGRGADVRRIFVSKTLVVGAIISLFSVLLSPTFIRAANGILISSIEESAGIYLHGLTIMKVIPTLLVLDALILLFTVIASSLFTSLILRSIKPVEIIKAKE